MDHWSKKKFIQKYKKKNNFTDQAEQNYNKRISTTIITDAQIVWSDLLLHSSPRHAYTHTRAAPFNAFNNTAMIFQNHLIRVLVGTQWTRNWKTSTAN